MTTVRERKYQDWWIQFGSGDLVHFEHSQPYVNEEGESWVKFFITPVSELIDKYDLREGEEIDIKSGLIEMDYPEQYVFPLPSNPEQKKIMVELDLLGNHTNYSRRHMAIKERNRILEKQIREMNSYNHQLQRDNRILHTRFEEALKRMTDIRKIIRDKETVSQLSTEPPDPQA